MDWNWGQVLWIVIVIAIIFAVWWFRGRAKQP